MGIFCGTEYVTSLVLKDIIGLKGCVSVEIWKMELIHSCCIREK